MLRDSKYLYILICLRFVGIQRFLY